MDKHQRKQLSRWETKKAKTESKFEERMTQERRKRDYETVRLMVQDYQPPLHTVFAQAREIAKTVHLSGLRWMDFLAFEAWIPIGIGRRITYLQDVCIADEVARRRQLKTEMEAMRLSIDIRRHTQRVDIFREELMLRAHRLRAIQACRYGFKEELMQVVWHPDRVGRILETYGWEVLDNLLGVE